MTPKQMRDLVKQLGPVVAAQVIEKAKAGQVPAPKQARERAKGQAFGQFALAFLAAGGAKGMPERSIFADRLKSFGSEDMSRGLQESVFTAGGSTVPVEYASDFIELLYPTLVLQDLGATYRPFKSEVVIGRQDSGTTGEWVGEGKAPAKSTPTTGQIKLKARKYAALSDVSNDIIRNPAVGFDDVKLTNDMVTAARDAFEAAGINGAGTEYVPTGLLKLMDTSQLVNKSGTDIAHYIADVDKLVKIVDDTDRVRQKRGFLMSTTVEVKLLGLRDAAGYVFRDEMLARGTLRGFPYRTSAKVDPKYLLFGEWSDLVWGVDTDVELTSSNAPRFGEDETTFRLIMRGDFQVYRRKSFAGIKDY